MTPASRIRRAGRGRRWLGLLFLSLTFTSVAQETNNAAKPARAPMPIFITPYYISAGPKVVVGSYSVPLRDATADTILQVANDFKRQRNDLRAEVMFITAIRLYDLGQKDEAVYWFYTAQYRARLFGMILDQDKLGPVGTEGFDLEQAYGAFQELAGEYINGYAFNDLSKFEKTVARVLEEGKSVPKFRELYPNVKFIPEKQWTARNKDVSKGLTELIDFTKKNADLIRDQRKTNGTEGKY